MSEEGLCKRLQHILKIMEIFVRIQNAGSVQSAAQRFLPEFVP